jgi:ADP-ribose pyrophosphatase YjhB (NUDIX family)
LVDERDEAARRELSEETGVDVPSLLTRFGAYGDPRRDPRMNVVNLAHLAVLRDVGAIVAGTDAAHAALVPASDILEERIELAFNHLPQPRGRGRLSDPKHGTPIHRIQRRREEVTE